MRGFQVAILGAIVVAFTLVAVRGLAAPWPWGHHGYNGAQYAQAARNSLRFGVVAQAPYHTGLEAPAPDVLYTHHPLMLHAHLVPLHAVFGEAEWAARIVPAAYSVASLLMLFFMVRRWFGVRHALLAASLFALTPVTLSYANMVDHEQGGLFFCLLLLYLYLCWDEEGRRRHFVGMLVAVTLGGQFDWPVYYVAFLVAVHAFVRAQGGGVLFIRWRPVYTRLAIFSAVTLVNFFGYMIWVHVVRGDLDDMGEALSSRFGIPWRSMPRLLRNELYLHGPLLLGLLVGGIFVMRRRLQEGRLHRGHAIVAVFVVVQLIHSTAFGSAARYHEYWVFYLTPAIAAGGAEALFGVRAWLEARGVPRAPRASLVPAVLVLQVVHSAWAYGHVYGSGGSLFWEDYVDHYDQAMWARAVGERHARGTVQYRIHPSVRDHRIEMTYYLDGPTRLAWDLRPDGVPPEVMLMDLDDPAAPRTTRQQLAGFLKRWGAHVYDERFVVIDPTLAPEASRAFAREPRAVPVGWDWLAGLGHEPYRFRDTGALPDWDRLLEGASSVLVRPFAGGGGGDPFQVECPEGPIGELEITTDHWDTGDGPIVVAGLRVGCADGARHRFRGRDPGPRPPDDAVACGVGKEPVGFDVRGGRAVDAFALLCRRPDDNKPLVTRFVGGPGGSPSRRLCPVGKRVIGVRGRSGAVLDAIAPICSK